MYVVKLIERFEDWYVAGSTVGEFKTIDEAVTIFCKECEAIIGDNGPLDWLENYITETFEADELEDVDIDQDYSKGMVVLIEKGLDKFASRYFEYSYKYKKVSDQGVELDLGSLTEEEAAYLKSTLSKLENGTA